MGSRINLKKLSYCMGGKDGWTKRPMTFSTIKDALIHSRVQDQLYVYQGNDLILAFPVQEIMKGWIEINALSADIQVQVYEELLKQGST